MAKSAVAAASVDVDRVDIDAIDRLEQKLKQLVAVLDRVRAEHAQANSDLARTRGEYQRATDENARLRAEVDTTRARIAEAEGTGSELTALRQEREQIRGRVNDMLKQIEALNL
jgi:chromosome segregation ATPase